MSTFKKYALLMTLLHSTCMYAMNLRHIVDRHVYDSNKKYTDTVTNHQNGVMSAISSGQRKTTFPKDIS